MQHKTHDTARAKRRIRLEEQLKTQQKINELMIFLNENDMDEIFINQL